MLCAPASALRAQPTVTITSPSEGAVFNPGKVLDITARATPFAFRTVVVVLEDLVPSGLTDVLRAPPYAFRIKIPSDAASKPYTLMAVGVTEAGHAVDSEPVTIAVERAESPLKLESDLHTLAFHYTTGSVALVVEGTFPDGSKVSLTRSTLTKYVSSRPTVATVDANVVTAVGLGSAGIIITNGKARLVIPVTVPRNRRPEDAKH
jgi:hypothetical protein